MKRGEGEQVRAAGGSPAGSGVRGAPAAGDGERARGEGPLPLRRGDAGEGPGLMPGGLGTSSAFSLAGAR
eukprot:7687418-Pyramimonas_sp.AAC.1